ncbi:class I SAM-dependent methyltransferase [Pseudonocardia sp. N23]|uniref:class I SAM-dependent methyltransferase n=1 Tax=Pseudonocardia sp. N23 TaxID=1987376 RepID=UPI000BFBF392|nr:class I SAM-dependent methyltransferase [Pseudonocardia sp. N23]GAY09741.1 methyltransferase [Pseudonocardia sp. N23]
MTDPTLGELTVGVEGLALLRTLHSGDSGARAERLTEIRDVLGRADLGSPLGSEVDVDAGYVQWSRSYDGPLRLFAVESAAVRPLLEDRPPGTVLDAACGTGRWSEYLAGRGHTVVGVDRSPAMLDLARTKVPGGRFDEGRLDALPLDDASVDAAVCALAMVHVPDLRPVFAELARVVRPGGRVVVSDVHPFLVTLGWQAQFPGDDGRAYIRLHAHLMSDYAGAALAAGFAVRGIEEPLLTAEAAATPTATVVPAANAAAYVGLPAVVVWEFERM